MRPVDQPFEVHVDHAGMVFDRDVPEVPKRANAHVVDPYVDPPKTVDRRGREPGNGGGVAHVGLNGDRVPAVSDNLCREIVEQLPTTGGKHNVPAELGQRQRGAPAKSARRSRDDNGLACETLLCAHQASLAP
jgi:hypothetical protein